MCVPCFPGSVVGPAAADAPVQRVRVARDVPARRDGEEQEGHQAWIENRLLCHHLQFLNSVTNYGNDCTAEGCQYGEEDAEVPQLVCEESGEGRREDEEDGDDGVDHRGLLHADAQILKRWKEGGMCQQCPMIT